MIPDVRTSLVGRVRRAVDAASRVPPRRIPTLLHAACLYVVAEMALRVRPLPAVAKWFGLRLVLEETPVVYPAQAPWLQLTSAERRKLAAVRQLSRRLYGAERGCLRRSLVLGHLLRRRRPTLHLGVRRVSDDGVVAHAWIEVAGVRLEAQHGWGPLLDAG